MRARLQGRHSREHAQSNGQGGPRAPQGSYAPMMGGAWGTAHIEEDLVLPEQYFERLRQKTSCPGEQQLMLAVLEDAVHCYKSNLFTNNVRRQKLFAEAEEWLFDPTSDALVTFDYVCSVFGLDSEYLRAGLRRWREQKQKGTFRAPVAETPEHEVAEPVHYKRAVGE